MTPDDGVSLRDHLDQRIDDLTRLMTDRFAMSEAAVAKAERTMNDRLNSMNEFRDALRDQANRMATRVEMDKLDEAIQSLQRDKANREGRMALITGGISLVISFVMSLALWAVSRLATP